MSRRDDLLKYARYLSDTRAARCAGTCHSHLTSQSKEEPVTPTPCTILAELLPDLPESIVQYMTQMASGVLSHTSLSPALPELVQCMELIPKLDSRFLHMVLVFAKGLYDAQVLSSRPQEVTAE